MKSAAQFSHLLFQFPKAIPQGGNLCQAPGGYTGVGSLTLERVIQLASGSRTMFPSHNSVSWRMADISLGLPS